MHNRALSYRNTLVLRSLEEGTNLCYVVEVEFAQSTKCFYRGENYNQAMYVARKVYNWLIENSEPFAMMLEEPQAQGIAYLDSEVDQFPAAIDESEDFYSDLCDEFETSKLAYIHDLNLLFRKMVNHFKLNQYQELRFLKELKRKGHV